ncbi:MAG TPA: hypothetical protein VIU34_17610 [Steroidobacter sp.]
MNQDIQKELEILWSEFDENDVNEKLAAFKRLKAVSTRSDLPQLINAIESERNDFWTRELLSDPISDLGGVDYLPELFDALEKNQDEGHDNDGFCHHLTEIASADPAACKRKLQELISADGFGHKDTARWLLEFCE